MATHSRSFGDGLTTKQLVELTAPYDPLLDTDSWIYRHFGDLNFIHIGARLIYQRHTERAKRLTKVLPREGDRWLLNGLGLEATGKREEARDALRKAVKADPGSAQARFAFVRTRLGSMVKGEADEESRTVAAGLVWAVRPMPW